MLNNDKRRLFWETLLDCHDYSEKTVEKLWSAVPYVKSICRFRSVNERTLEQLRSNRLFFSSADYYDDPFDTYFYIDYSRVRNTVKEMSSIFASAGIGGIRAALLALGMSAKEADYVEKHIPKDMPETSYFESELKSIRHEVQKSCYSICFCDDPFNESLWLKYADAHKGFVQVYDLDDSSIIRCGKSKRCDGCMFEATQPPVYPVYYSDRRYDATQYATFECMLKNLSPSEQTHIPESLNRVMALSAWEIERISLVKKKCHEYDGEWRMVCPHHPQEPPAIGMKPSFVALGMRMPEHDRKLVVSAAKDAGVEFVYEMYIDENDNLNMRSLESR